MKITFESKAGVVVVWDDVPEELSKLLNVRSCAKHFGINENTAWARVARGWPVLMALAATEDNKQ